MRQFHLDTCPKIQNWECEWAAECTTCGVNMPCTFDFIQTLQPHRLLNLLEDNVNRHNRPCGAEAHLVRLNPFEAVGRKEFGMIVGTDLRFHKDHKGKRWSSDIVEILNGAESDSGRIVPYKFPNKNPTKKRNLRNSEFNNSDKNPIRVCRTIGGIIGKLDDKKIPAVADKRLADIGTDAHALINQQHVKNYQHNQTLRHLDIKPMSRDKWCERDTRFIIEIKGKEYVIGGKADMVARFENVTENFLRDYKKHVLRPMGFPKHDPSDEIICVFDIKRSRYGADETISHMMQLLSNVYGINQEFDAAMLSTIKSPFVNGRNPRHKSQKYHFNLVARDGPLVEKFKEEIVTRYKNQAQALDDLEFYLDCVRNCKKRSYCLSGDYCNFLFEEISSQRKRPYDVLKSMDLILPDVELPN